MLRPTPQAPATGWRRAVHRLTGGLVNPGPSPAELVERALAARVKTPITGSRRIAVISRKGGVGKTTTAALVGHTFASWRGDRVGAVDGNPDAGSLGYRVRLETAATLTSLLADAEDIARYAGVRAYTSQAPTGLEVIASDDDPGITRALCDDDYATAIGILDHYYNLLLLDTGTGILNSGIQGILREADQLIVVVAPALDGARVAAATLDWLDRHGYAHLTATAVAAINGVRPDAGLVEVARVEEHFAARCAATVRIPFDPHLQAGAQTTLDDLAPSTRRAYLDVAAATADHFALRSHRGPMPTDPRRRKAHIMHISFILAQVSVSPDSAALPGTQQLQSLVNGLAFWGLLACVGVLLAGAAFWAGGSRSSNYGAVANGKTMVFGGAVGAALIGGASAIVNFFHTVGTGVG